MTIKHTDMEGTERNNVKRIPYGISGFEGVRERNCYYVDKTAYIERIEEAHDFFFFIRPRRFGKSLLLSTLENYYDLNKKEKFQELFGDLYIGQHPTPLRNSYLVLSLNFSTISSQDGGYKKSLDRHCLIQFRSFCNRYASLLPQDALQELNSFPDAISQFQLIATSVRKSIKRFTF